MREMNTIEIDGKTYEVLTLDRISEITHAKLAGEIFGATHLGAIYPKPDCIMVDGDVYTAKMQSHNNIQPLRLVPREPVTFEATFALVNGFWTRITCLDDGIAYQHKEKKNFRCVEIVEEAK
jgi:hypothetical protein